MAKKIKKVEPAKKVKSVVKDDIKDYIDEEPEIDDELDAEVPAKPVQIIKPVRKESNGLLAVAKLIGASSLRCRRHLGQGFVLKKGQSYSIYNRDILKFFEGQGKAMVHIVYHSNREG